MQVANPIKEKGTDAEVSAAAFFRGHGLSYPRASLSGKNDLLDLSGTRPHGLLIGVKGRGKPQPRPDGTIPDRMYEAVGQSEEALGRLPLREREYVMPVQLIQNPRFPVRRWYAVTRADWLVGHAKWVAGLTDRIGYLEQLLDNAGVDPQLYRKAS
jgi:hypothetical protein